MTWEGQKGHPDVGMTHRVVMHTLLVCIQEILWTLSHTTKYVESTNLQSTKLRAQQQLKINGIGRDSTHL